MLAADGAPMLMPIEGTTKTDQIIAALKAHVFDGKLKSGTEFPSEKELALQLGVSRFSLREALRVAEAQGLIEISRGRRAKVAKPSAAAAAEIISLSLRGSTNTLRDLAEARLVLETHIAGVAARKISTGDIAALEETVKVIETHPRDVDLWVAQDLEFHGILVRATGNIVFEIMLAPLSELLKEARRHSLDADTKSVVTEHTAIIAALKARDSDEAARCMSRHLTLSIKRQLRATTHAVARSSPGGRGD
jgi:DNA-binding FadR family transcriptional regulator